MPTDTESHPPHLEPVASTSEPSTASAKSYWEQPGYLRGLRLFESRLLTLIENTNPDNLERLQSLNESLADIRQEIAEMEPKISGGSPVISLALAPDKSPQLTPEHPTSSKLPVLEHQDFCCSRSPTEPRSTDRNVSPTAN
jgi:hypothetical protein